MVDDEYSPEEIEALKQMSLGYPQEEEKQNIFSFFKRVILMKDTSRTAFLNKDELGLTRLPVRTCQEIGLFLDKMGNDSLSQYFKDRAQIITNTSLSRDGFLDNLAVTQKRQVESRRRRATTLNKGWFKKKQPVSEFEEY